MYAPESKYATFSYVHLKTSTNGMNVNSIMLDLNGQPGLFHTHTSSKNIIKHVRQHFPSSSLIAKPENGLHLLFGG